MAREPRAAREIVDLPGRRPLAVQIALSYDSLSAERQRAFRTIGFLDTPDVAVWAVAALLDRSVDEAERLLDHLVDIHLIMPGASAEASVLSRFQMHDLVRAFARERAEAQDPRPERVEAVSRALRAYTVLAEHAYLRMEPDDIHKPNRSVSAAWWPAGDQSVLTEILADPARWFARERTCLIAAAEQAFQLVQNDLAVQLTIALYGSFRVGAHWTSWQHVYSLALDAARLSDDRCTEAEVLLRLGDVYKNSGRVDGPGGTPIPDREDLIAADLLEQSWELFQRFGNAAGVVAVLRRLGGVYRDLGQYERSTVCYEQGLSTAAQVPDPELARAYLLRGRSALLRMSGHPREAVSGFAEALATFRAHGDVRGEAGALRGVGECWLILEDWEQAHHCGLPQPTRRQRRPTSGGGFPSVAQAGQRLSRRAGPVNSRSTTRTKPTNRTFGS